MYSVISPVADFLLKPWALPGSVVVMKLNNEAKVFLTKTWIFIVFQWVPPFLHILKSAELSFLLHLRNLLVLSVNVLPLPAIHHMIHCVKKIIHKVCLTSGSHFQYMFSFHGCNKVTKKRVTKYISTYLHTCTYVYVNYRDGVLASNLLL